MTLGLLASWLALVSLGYVVWRQKQRLNRFFSTNGDSGLENNLQATLKNLETTDKTLKELQKTQQTLTSTLELAAQKVSIVRFNPFQDTGGDQSFAIAILDGQNSGLILTSIHGRQGTRVYVKPVDLGKSRYTLSTEEKQVLKQAIARSRNLKEDK